MTVNKVRVLIVDDHDVVRMGLQLLFSRMEQYEVVAEAKDAREAIARASETKPDLVLMDVRLPGQSGIEACREILQLHPETKVLMLTSYADEEAVMASLIAGARGFVVKEIGSAELLEAIKRVTRGEYLLDPAATGKVVRGILKKHDGRPDKMGLLTQKEYEIFLLLIEGKTNREIADAVFLSEKTVRNYVSNILSKLELGNRTQVASFAARERLGSYN